MARTWANGMRRPPSNSLGSWLIQWNTERMEAPAEGVEHGDHDHGWGRTGAKGANGGEQLLVLWAVVARAREHVLVLAADDPAVLGGVAAALAELCIEREAFACLLVAGHTRIN